MAIFNWQVCIVLSGQVILSWIFSPPRGSDDITKPNKKKERWFSFFGLVHHFFF